MKSVPNVDLEFETHVYDTLDRISNDLDALKFEILQHKIAARERRKAAGQKAASTRRRVVAEIERIAAGDVK